MIKKINKDMNETNKNAIIIIIKNKKNIFTNKLLLKYYEFKLFHPLSLFHSTDHQNKQ